MNMPKSHCRRQSGMNFGYVTVNGVNSNCFARRANNICEYMFALWGGMWYDESEVMNFAVICSEVMLERIAVGRRMYHDCVCSWNGCGYN